MTDWHRSDIAGLADAYRTGRTTVVKVVRHHLKRIAAIDPVLHSYIEVDTVSALHDAAVSQSRIDAGEARVLEGVPIAVKANIAVAGLEWNAGMAARRGIVADRDAAVVARLKEAGAIILGTLNMHEAALGATSDNPFFGRVANPHDTSRTPGGSSGGSGAAVAAGLCTVALGTDTMGSVRIPAAYNGVYGLKPGEDTLSADGLLPASEALDMIGPIARSLGDLAAVAVAFGLDTIVAPPVRLLTLDAAYGLESEPEIDAALAQALDTLPSMAHETLTLVDDAAAIRFAGFVSVARELKGHLSSAAEAGFSDELRFMLDYAARRSPDEVTSATETLARTRATLRAAIGEDGVLVTPTAPQAAFPHTNRPPATQSGFTALANIAGLPALTLPAGRNADGMPIGVQLIGAPGAEGALIELARRIDARLNGYFAPAMLNQGET